MIGYFKQRGAVWVTPVLYGLGCAALVAAIILAVVGLEAIPTSKPRVTPENVEGQLKTWAENNGLGITKPQIGFPETHFSYVFTLKNGNPVVVMRPKGNPRRLEFHSYLSFSEEHQKAYAGSTKEEQADFLQQISLQLGLAQLGNAISTATPIQTVPGNVVMPFSAQVQVDVMKGIPISELDEETFAHLIDEIDSGISIVRATTALTLKSKKIIQ